MAASPGQVILWIDKCQQNIERMQRTRIDAKEFRAQYGILANIVKVTRGESYFTGTQFRFPSQVNR